jgi:hypothetical protein
MCFKDIKSPVRPAGLAGPGQSSWSSRKDQAGPVGKQVENKNRYEYIYLNVYNIYSTTLLTAEFSVAILAQYYEHVSQLLHPRLPFHGQET